MSGFRVIMNMLMKSLEISRTSYKLTYILICKKKSVRASSRLVGRGFLFSSVVLLADFI